MLHIRFRRRALVLCAVTALSAGCGGTSTTLGQGFCPATLPLIELLYPIPGTKGVSPSVGQMVFASTGLTRIQLAVGTYPYGARIATRQEPLPNPLPTPIATPGPYAQYLTTEFAVTFETLKPHTKYAARAWTTYNQAPCNGGEAIPPGWADLGSFWTQ